MLIKDLKKDYPLVYQAALENQYKQSRSRNDKIPLLESVKGVTYIMKSLKKLKKI
jgi:hypothetical protein